MASHVKLDAIEDHLALFGIIKQHTRSPDRRVEWKVSCRGEDCTEALALHWGPGAPPEVLIRDVKRRGWQIDRGDRPLCPSCLRAIKRRAKELGKAKKTPPPVISITAEQLSEATAEINRMFDTQEFTPNDIIEAVNTVNQEATPPEQEPPVMTVTPSPTAIEVQASPRIARLLHELLGEFFDERNGAYRSGYSDERIAQEVGCHVGVVQRVRGEAYGDLTEDTRISALREDLTRFERALDKIEKTARGDIDALRSRLEQIAMATKSR